LSPVFNKNQTNKLHGTESASELYRPSDRRFSAKWLPTFADKGPLFSTGGQKFPCSQRRWWILNKWVAIWDIFGLDTNDGPPQHYRPPNRTWNAYWLDPNLSTSSRLLAITTHLNTQLLHTSIKIWKLSEIVSADTSTLVM
jgi:hypothetical protein